mmetsp:Transcript_25412/g.71263  ORF Transcript_25412/g.71263 Transcript_25412/m.71263 type:complete len:146 (-) Transcript_25412:240-677(-)
MEHKVSVSGVFFLWGLIAVVHAVNDCPVMGDLNSGMMLVLGSNTSELNTGCLCLNTLPDFVDSQQESFSLTFYIGYYDPSLVNESLTCTVYNAGIKVKEQPCPFGGNLGYGPVATKDTHCITVSAPEYSSAASLIVPVFAALSPN